MSLLVETVVANGKEFDIDLPKDTKINPTLITEALVEQPGLVAYYGELKAQATFSLAQVKDELESLKARIRKSTKMKNADIKMTVQDLQDAVDMDPSVADMKEMYNEVELVYEKAAACVNAMKERGTALVTIATLARYEHSAIDTIMEETAKTSRRKG